MTTFTTNNFSANQIPPASVLQAVQDSIDALCPVGSYLMVHMTPPASGTLVNGAWLACDGTPVSAATYVNLYNTIGTIYNTGGEGTGNFRLPDFCGRSPFVAASGGNSDASLGKNDGAALASRRMKHSHTVTDSHSHTGSGDTDNGGAHTHSQAGQPNVSASLRGSATRAYGTFGSSFTWNGGRTDGGPSHSHSVNSLSYGSGTAGVSFVGNSGDPGLTDGPAFLVCCTVLIRAL